MLCLSHYCLSLLFNKIGEEGRREMRWVGAEGGGRGQRGEMAQTVYAHLNK
jgi:hypothetical protein